MKNLNFAAKTLITLSLLLTGCGRNFHSGSVLGGALSNGSAFLSTLTLSSGDISPTFSSDTTSGYVQSVACETGSLAVTPTAEDGDATIQVKINSGDYVTVASGESSDPLTLTGGTANVISVKVTSFDDLNVKTYTMTVTRAAADLNCQVKGFWHLDEPDPGRGIHAADSSPAANNLPYFGSVNVGVTGQTNSAISEDGTTGYLYDSSGPVVNVQTATVSAWVYPTAYPNTGEKARIAGLAQGDEASVNDKDLYIDSNGKPLFYVFSNNLFYTNVANVDPLPLNTWSHIVGVVDGLNIYMYVNGVKKDHSTCGLTFAEYTLANIMIGGSDSIGSYFTGGIDEVGMWGRGLNDAEVLDLYTHGYTLAK